MKDSDFFLLCANIALAPHLGRGWAFATWAVFMTGYGLAMYLGK